MSIEIKKLGKQDIDKFIELIRVFEDVFEMKNFKMPDKNYLQQLLEKNSFFVFVALSDDKVIAGLTSYTLQQYYSTSPLVYLYDLAVKTEFQRQGIPFKREQEFKLTYKDVVLPQKYFADFVVMDKIILEAKAIECLTDSHVKQTLNYLAASKLKLGLLVNFGEDSLNYKRVVL